MEYFKKFFSKELYGIAATNKYYVQKTGNNLKIK